MSLCLPQSRVLVELRTAPITVEVHLANGLPSFTLVGLADTEVKESRKRVRSALQNCGLEFPSNWWVASEKLRFRSTNCRHQPCAPSRACSRARQRYRFGGRAPLHRRRLILHVRRASVPSEHAQRIREAKGGWLRQVRVTWLGKFLQPVHPRDHQFRDALLVNPARRLYTSYEAQ